MKWCPLVFICVVLKQSKLLVGGVGGGGGCGLQENYTLLCNCVYSWPSWGHHGKNFKRETLQMTIFQLCNMVTAIKVVHFCVSYFDCAFAESFASVVFVVGCSFCRLTMFVKLLAVHFADSQCCPVCTQQVLVNGKSNVVLSDCLTLSVCVSSSVCVSLLVCVSSSVYVSLLVCVSSSVCVSLLVCVSSSVSVSLLVCVSSSVCVSLLVCVSSLAQHRFVWRYLFVTVCVRSSISM